MGEICILRDEAEFRDPNIMRKSLLLVLAVPLLAQDPLSLREAVRLALRENKAIAATNAGMRAAADTHRRGPRRQAAQAELFRILRAQRQPGLCFQLAADPTPVWCREFQYRSSEPAGFLEQFPVTADGGPAAVRRRPNSQRGEIGRSLAADERRRAAPNPDASDCRRGQSLLRRGAGGGKPQDGGAGAQAAPKRT